MFSFLLEVSKYILPVILVVVFLVACARYIFKFSFFNTKSGLLFSFRNLAIVVVVGKIFNAGLLTYLQYSVWKQSGVIGEVFLNSPISKDLPFSAAKNFEWLLNNKFGYFLFYSWGRFWLSVLISLLVAYVFYLLLRTLKLKTERFFEEGETELGFLCALVVGWPGFVLFVPFVFLSVVFISIVKLLFFKEKYTTLGAPFILATTVTSLFSNYLILLFGLGVLKV